MGFFSFFSKEKKETLDKGLSKTKESVFSKIARAVAGKSKVDDEVLDNLEEVLITSDVGVETTLNIIKRIEKRAAADKYVNTQELNHILRDEIAALLTENNSDDVADFDVPIERKPYVIMVVGVNGVGKTTTIGKLAYQFKKAGKSVYLGAADTFRAAAVEQLMIWGDFMGNEFGHPEWIDFPREGNGWSCKYARRQWNLVDNKNLAYHYLGDFDCAMLEVIKSVKNFQTTPIQEIWHNDGDQILAYMRKDLIFVFNFNPKQSFTDYGFLVPAGKYEVILNTDNPDYGGHGLTDDTVKHFTLSDPLYKKEKKEWLKLYIPARTAMVLKRGK